MSSQICAQIGKVDKWHIQASNDHGTLERNGRYVTRLRTALQTH